MGEPTNLLDRRLLLFTGKGGVGKTTIAAGVALEAARRGKRPLIVEMGHRASMESIFGVRGIGYEPQAVGRGIHAMNLDFEQSLYEYMVEHVRVARVARAVLSNQALQRFFHAAPAVAEIAALNKVSSLVREREADGSVRWDPVIVDLDATGHALMLLNLPSVMDGLVGAGPMRALVDGFSGLLADPRRTVLSLITLPRELPTQETCELFAKLRADHKVPLGALFINRVPVLPVQDELLPLLDHLRGAVQAQPDHPLARPVRRRLELARIATERRDRAQEQIDRLARDVPLPTAKLPAISYATLDLDRIAELGAAALAAVEAPA